MLQKIRLVYPPNYFGKSYIIDSYKDFSRYGKWTFWHDNGQKSHEGVNRMGEYHETLRMGVWKYWDVKGKLIKKEFYNNSAFPIKTYMTDNYSEVPFTVINTWDEHEIKNSEVLLINDRETYVKKFNEKYKEYSSKLTPQNIDFERNQVVAFFWGQKSSTGYSMSVTSVKGNKKEIEIKVKTTTPNGLTSPAITYPAIAIAVPKSDKVKIIITGDRKSSKSSTWGFTNVKSKNLEVIVDNPKK